MATSDNRLIVVRAWRDHDRLIIRLISSAGPTGPAIESVFVDVESATARFAEVLSELLALSPSIQQVPRTETKR